MEEDEKKNLHVLIVDDEASSRETIAEYLRTLGYKKISMARNGAEAMTILGREAAVDLVISDWDMPLMDGLELLQRIRNHPHRAHIPFLVVTSPVSKEMEKVVLAAENLVDSYLIKPFRIQILEEKIEQVMSRSIHGPQKEVVLADDDEDARAMIAEYLEQFGFKEIIPFENGSSALDYVLNNSKKIGLIVSDWEMPDLNGLEFLQTCKSNKDLSNIPFLMVTSQTSIEKMKIMQAARSSVDQYLLKPFTHHEIKDRIDRLMGKFRSRKEVQELLQEGIKNIGDGRYAASREIFEQVLKLDPQQEVALRALGDVLIKIKTIDAALPYYKRAVDANPYNPKNYLILSSAYEQKGFLDKAVSLIEVANETISFSAELHFRLGELLYKKEEFERSLFELQRAIELQPDYKEAQKLAAKVRTLIEA